MSMQEAEAKDVSMNPLATEDVNKVIRKFAVPAIISLLVNAIYNIVDQIFIGQGIGTIGIAATNVAFPLNTISTAVSLLIGVGSASFFNLSLGAGDTKSASRVVGNAMLMGTICGSTIGVIAFVFVEPLLRFFGATDDIMVYAHSYTAIIAIGLPFMIMTTITSNLIRADGSPKYAMACMLAGAIFNVIFDPVFMFGFGWGIEGIAWATTLGQMLSAGMGIYYVLKKFRTIPIGKSSYKLESHIISRVCAIGAGACFNQLAMTVVQILLNNTLKYYGELSVYGSEIPIACVGVVTKISYIFISFPIGIGHGCQPLVSFNYGARNFKRVKAAYKVAIITATISTTAAFLMFQLFPRQLIGIFGQGTEEYFQFATMYLRIYLCTMFLNGIQPVTSNFFTSIGKAKIGLLMSMTRQLICLAPLLIIFPMIWGIDGVMYTAPIADTAAAILAGIFITREMRLMTEMGNADKALARAV